MPLLDLFWTMLLLFLWFAWIYILIKLVADLFRRDDISGWAKAAWLLFMLFLPYLGVLVYLITQSRGMAERDAQQAAAIRDASERYIREVAASSGSGPSTADELERLARMRDQGDLTAEEFERLKARALQ